MTKSWLKTLSSDAGVKSKIVPSIRNSMDLAFAANTTLPNDTQILNTIVRAAKNNTLPFEIYTYSIIVNNTGKWCALILYYSKTLIDSLHALSKG